ncbi:alpha/beta fold hydrolase [Muricoccus radiodurans]|uniref:alpha/beta fold hydrolase n=1 Tax=Muricoccus radiodurans TaxID=2231721 RepID=UPI003CFBBC27
MALSLTAAGAGPAGAAMPEGRHAQLPGVRLWYVDTGGSGTPLVMLHANTGTIETWEPQIAPFAAAGYRVIAFDRRGWGRSEPDPSSGPQPGTVTEDLDALVRHLGLDRFHLLGVAGGGFVALDYGGWRPERLLSLIVGASYGNFSEPEIRTFFDRVNSPEFQRQPSELREIGPTYRGTNPDGVARWIAIEHGSRRAGAPAQPLRTPNTYAKIAAITCPALVIAAGADLYAPPALMQMWARRLPRHEWDVIPEAGHAIAWEYPEAFNEKVLAFLRKV